MTQPTPASPIRLEAATLLLERTATPQFAQFMEALRGEYEVAVRDLLGAHADNLQLAQGVAVGLNNLIHRLMLAEKTLAEHEARAKQRAHHGSQTQERAR